MRKTHALSLFVAAALGVTAVGAYAKGGAGGNVGRVVIEIEGHVEAQRTAL